jgi:DNA-binding response OmpR family regulator
MPQNRDEAINAGIDDYLTKPIAVEAFLASINKVLNS